MKLDKKDKKILIWGFILGIILNFFINKFIDIVKNKDKNTDNDDILLTKQERNILELISEGKTNKEISIELYVAEKTVRNYVSTILKKINVDNRTEAAMYWIRQKSLI